MLIVGIWFPTCQKGVLMDYKELKTMAIRLDPEQDIWQEHPYQPEPYLLTLRSPMPHERKNFNFVGAGLTWIDESLIQWCIYATPERIQVLRDEGYTLNMRMYVPFTGAEPVWPEDVATAWEASKPTI